ncbi:MAG: hypothetical protein ACYTXY_40120 [Nostoc sp.]
MLKTIQGIYKTDKIELAETPEGITENLVFVTFLETKPSQWPEIIMQYSGIKESIIFESYREELIPPKEIEL